MLREIFLKKISGILYFSASGDALAGAPHQGGGVLMIMHAIVIRPLTSHPYKAGTEHAGFSPDQARTQSPSAKRRSVFGESHEG